MQKEVPILFSTPMVNALLKGRKTQTRRIANPIDKPKCAAGDLLWVRENIFCHPIYNAKDAKKGYCGKLFEDGKPVAFRGYVADEPNYKLFKWKGIPSIHMPKAAARIWLRCTGVRLERLQDISTTDIIAEGVQLLMSRDKVLYELGNPNGTYAILQELTKTSGRTGEGLAFFTYWAELWIKINGRESWTANPSVWVYEFEVVSTTGNPRL